MQLLNSIKKPFLAGDSAGLKSLLGLLTILVLNLVGSVVWRGVDFLLLSAVTEEAEEAAAALSKASCLDCCLAVKRRSVGGKLPSGPFCWFLFVDLSLSLLLVAELPT